MQAQPVEAAASDSPPPRRVVLKLALLGLLLVASLFVIHQAFPDLRLTANGRIIHTVY